MSRNDEVIRASEIGQYVFCARAWWYDRVKGYRPENVAALRRGSVRHRRHGRRVAGYHLLRRLALILLLLGVVAVVAWLILGRG